MDPIESGSVSVEILSQSDFSLAEQILRIKRKCDRQWMDNVEVTKVNMVRRIKNSNSFFQS